MATFPPLVQHELEGWTLFWAELEALDGRRAATSELLQRSAERAGSRLGAEPVAEHPIVAVVRRLFRSAGCDPTRYRPSSEALLRRVLKGENLPGIHPLVDLNNCLSLELLVPCCVVAAMALRPPLTLRAGRPGEAMVSLRGPFDLEGKPLLADDLGPFGTPITDSERVKIRDNTSDAWLVAYLPEDVVPADVARSALQSLLDAAPVARLHGTATSGKTLESG